MHLSELTTAKNLPANIHANAVSFAGLGVLILGPSASGKSSLSLQLMAYGALLISDDIVHLDWVGSNIMLSRPREVSEPGQIEARGLGILVASLAEPTKLNLCIDLCHVETERLPDPISLEIDEVSVPCIQKVENPAFPAMILQYLKQMQIVDPRI